MSIGQDKLTVQTRYDKLSDNYTHNYESGKSLFSLEKQRRSDILMEEISEAGPANVLDLGCGPGYVAFQVVIRFPETRVVGIDFSQRMIGHAQANYGTVAAFLLGDIEYLPIPSDSIDFIIALGVLGKFTVPRRVLTEVFRTLRATGVFLFTYPNRDSAARRFRDSVMYLCYGRRARGQHMLSIRNLNTLVQNMGFEIKNIRHITYGNGVISLPWTNALNHYLEKKLANRSLGPVLAYSTVWSVTKK